MFTVDDAIHASKKAKQAYELTFTCAQAFDFNYRAFVAKTSAALDSSVRAVHVCANVLLNDLPPRESVFSR